jgi:hypothetical protein
MGIANRVGVEQINLFHSVIMLTHDQPIGQALLGLRGIEAWCGGLGIISEYRGKGLATGLLFELIKQAHEAGAKQLTLEVLQKNTSAQRLYVKAGFKHVRDLRLLEWIAKPQDIIQPDTCYAESMQMGEIIPSFYRLHSVRPTWTRDLSSLMLLPNLLQLTHYENDALNGYVLYTAKEGVARIYDLATNTSAIAEALLLRLRAAYHEIYSVNEPDDNRISQIYDDCGFQEYDRQHEFRLVI